MIITICLLILVYTLIGKDAKLLLEKLRNVNWKEHSNKAWSSIKEYAKQGGRLACEPLLKLWFVLDDTNTTIYEKALIYAAIIYTVSPISAIPASLYKFLGILDECAALLYVKKKVQNKMTPIIESKVKDVLDEWFGHESPVDSAKI